MGFLKHNNDSYVLVHTRCPRCAKNGKDRSHDNLGVYSDGHTFCYSCGYVGTASTLATGWDTQGMGFRENIFRNSSSKGRSSPSTQKIDVGSRPPGRTAGGNICDGGDVSRSWLEKHGVTDKDLHLYHITLAEDSVKFTLLKGDTPVYENIRYFSPSSPKYISKRLVPGTLWDPLRSQATSPDAPLVVVEDCISAIKVAKAGFKGFPLAGSNLNPRDLNRLVQASESPQATRIWLDPDKRLHGAKMALRINQFEGGSAKLIQSTMDPKYYKLETIKDIINGVS